MKPRLKSLQWLLALLLLSLPVQAHELQTAALRLDEVSTGRIQLTLKTPLSRDGGSAAVVPYFKGGDCQPQGEAYVERLPALVLRQWWVHCASGMAGQRLRMDGLDPRMPDAVVTARFADGKLMTAVLDRHDASIRLQPAEPAVVAPELLAYLPIGIEHILLGPDHLLFVLGLMLVVYAAGSGLRMLVLALTAFTLAHSLTLALAVLGVWGLPAKPVEVMIALSIALLAWELVSHPRRLAMRMGPSLTLRKPWLVAFVFGLLHGFGFAGALSQLGLPEQARGWALFLFNVGVEIGQLAFVMTMLLALALLRRLRGPVLQAGYSAVLVTALGGVAAYWTLDRLLLWSSSLLAGI